MPSYILLNKDKSTVINSVFIDKNDGTIDVKVNDPTHELVEMKPYDVYDFEAKVVKNVRGRMSDYNDAVQAELQFNAQHKMGARIQEKQIAVLNELFAVIEQGQFSKLYPNAPLPVSEEWVIERNIYFIINFKSHDPITQKMVSTYPYYEDGKVYSVKIENLTEEELRSNNLVYHTMIFEKAIMDYMDSKVKERNYDSIMSACTYDNSTNEKFRTEASACILWRDSVWGYCYSELEKVKTGERSLPAVSDFLLELPALIWPT